MAACRPPSACTPAPPSAGVPGGADGKGRQIIAIHLYLPEQRALVTYRETATHGRRATLCRVILHHGKFQALLPLLSPGSPGLADWLARELAQLECTPKSGGDEAKDKALVREVLGKLVAKTARYGATGHKQNTQARRPLDPRIVAVIALVEQAYHEHVSIERAAKAAHVSKSHFPRLFRQNVGTSFNVFVTKLRVHFAAALLLDEPFEKVINIAYRSGPWDLRTFERAFKKVMGCNPRRYRLRHFGGEEE